MRKNKRAQFQPHPDQLDLEDYIKAMTEEETERAHDAASTLPPPEELFPCSLPPEGWFCTRPQGHSGPCAAHPGYRLPSGATAPGLEATQTPASHTATPSPTDALESPSPAFAKIHAGLQDAVAYAEGDTSRGTTHYPDSFANYPESLTERRASDGSEWTIRDALIAALRDLDSGEIKGDRCLIIIADPTDDPDGTMATYQKTPSRQALHALLAATQLRYTAIAVGG